MKKLMVIAAITASCFAGVVSAGPGMCNAGSGFTLSESGTMKDFKVESPATIYALNVGGDFAFKGMSWGFSPQNPEWCFTGTPGNYQFVTFLVQPHVHRVSTEGGGAQGTSNCVKMTPGELKAGSHVLSVTISEDEGGIPKIASATMAGKSLTLVPCRQ